MKQSRSSSVVSNLSVSAMGSIQEHPGALGAAALRLSLGISTSLRIIQKWSSLMRVDAKSRREKAKLRVAERHARRAMLEQDSLKRLESQQESQRAFKVRFECLACPDKEDCPRHGPYVQHFNNIPLNNINPVGSPFIDYSVPCSAATRKSMRRKKSSAHQDATSLSNGSSALQALSDAITGNSISSSSSCPQEAENPPLPPGTNPFVHAPLPQPVHTHARAGADATLDSGLAAPPCSPVKAPEAALVPCSADSAIDLVAMLADREAGSSYGSSAHLDEAVAAASCGSSSTRQFLTPRTVQQQSADDVSSNNLTPRSAVTLVSIITTATNAEAAAAAVIAATSAQQAAQRVQRIAADLLPAHIAPAVLSKAEARMTASAANKAVRDLRSKSVLDNFAVSSPAPEVPTEHTTAPDACACADCCNAGSSLTGRNPSAKAVLPTPRSAYSQHRHSVVGDVQSIKNYSTLASRRQGQQRRPSSASSRQGSCKTIPRSPSSSSRQAHCKPTSAEMTAGAAAMYSAAAASFTDSLQHTRAYQDCVELPTAAVPATPTHLDAGKRLNTDRLDSWIAELVDNMVCSNMLSPNDSEVMKRILSPRDPNQKPWQHFKQAVAMQEPSHGMQLRR